MKSSVIVFLIMLALSDCRKQKEASQEPDNPNVPTPVVPVPAADVILTPRQKDYNHMTLTPDRMEWEVTTTANDPYLFVDAEAPVNIGTHYILSFESFNTTESLPLLLYVGTPLNANHLIEGYTLPRTEGWTSNAYDMSVTLEPPEEPFTSIRIRFGNTDGKTVRLRNFILRAPTDREKEQAEQREDNLRRDRELSERLQSYLTESFASSVTSVDISFHTGQVTVQGQYSGSSLLNAGLAEIPMWQDATGIDEPASFTPLTSSSANFTFERFAGDGHDRFLSGWAMMRKDNQGTETRYELLSPVRYADNITPRANLPKIVPASLKGIGGCPLDHQDMTDLGIASVTFNIILDAILYRDNAAGRVAYEYAGKTWYAATGAGSHVDGIDRDVRIAAQHGWMVSAILLIPVNRQGSKFSWLAQAAHPDTEMSAAFSMPNFTTREGAEAYAATIAFLAERYGKDDPGRIHHYIIHNEIQNGFYWTNAGRKTMETYMNLYQKSMRTVQTLARLYDPNAKTFISLDHDWNRKGDPRGYAGRDMLDLLVKFSRQEGDFEWGIAFHPYAQDINNPRTWEDNQAYYSFNTPYLTFKNLEVLDAWVEQASVLYKGVSPREIQFTEQGLNSPDYGEQRLKEQAAGMAYVWAKVERLRNVTAFQYHLWADAYEEAGLKLGLRKYNNAAGDPYGKKPIWYLYQACGTSAWETVAASYKAVIGVGNWSEAYYGGTIN
ncbi:MAG: DUF5722 domain-containing protein [Bacteroidales bacterium]|jgi:hypothetical protein|nr:DUF5722 domain-containing protein [Bacteroidales bacterium]